MNKGGSAPDAVEAAVRVLEDHPLFNAGRGTVLTTDRTIECDASIMCGKTLKAGATCIIRNVKNPISLAKAVMLESDHVFMAGSSAEKFAREQRLKFCADDYFLTDEKIEELESTKAEEEKNPIKDMVGAVALDKHGNIAAAVSTGGLTNSLSGRVIAP